MLKLEKIKVFYFSNNLFYYYFYMKKIIISLIVLISLSLNTFAVQEWYYKEQTSKYISDEIKKSEYKLKKHLENWWLCESDKIQEDIIKWIEISINTFQKKINDRYERYSSQLENYTEREDIMYDDLEKLKEDYEKADNLYSDFTARTWDYNYDLLRDSNYKYDLVDRKKKEIAKLIKEYSKYIDEFDKSDLEYYKDNTILKEEIISWITEKCLEMKEKIKPKKKGLTKVTKKIDTNNNDKKEKTKLELKQEKIVKVLTNYYKKSPKKIEALYPKVLKYKKRFKEWTTKYILLETIEKTIYDLMNK